MFVVEQNRDAQLRTLIINECGIDPARLVPILHYDGTPITARFIADAIGDHLDPLKVAARVASKAAIMTYIAKPKFHHPALPKNELGFTHRDYEGTISTLCAGCGHDSITRRDHPGLLRARHPAAPRRQAFRHRLLVEDADLFPRQLARLQLRARPHAVGADRRQPRQPRPDLSRRLRRRRFAPRSASASSRTSMRRGVNMIYIVENNGVYGLTKGQFSATADRGSKSKRGVANTDNSIDLVAMALQLGATFVARTFSGDKKQLVPLIKAAIEHSGAAFIDVISPCVAFNNHAGSTKSFDYVREHNEAVNRLDFITGRAPITVDYAPGTVAGGRAARRLDAARCASSAPTTTPHDRIGGDELPAAATPPGEVVTGLLYVDRRPEDLHAPSATRSTAPLNTLGEKELCPGSAALDKINASLR